MIEKGGAKMADHSIRQKKAHQKSVRLVIFVTLVFCALLLVQIIRTEKENAALKEDIEALQESVSAAESRRDELEAQKDRPLTREEIIDLARERFGLVFQNEIIFVPQE